MPKLSSDARDAYNFYSKSRKLIDPSTLTFGEESITPSPS